MERLLIVIVNSKLLQRPQKRGHGNQLIHRRSIKTKSIGMGSKSRESGRHTLTFCATSRSVIPARCLMKSGTFQGHHFSGPPNENGPFQGHQMRRKVYATQNTSY